MKESILTKRQSKIVIAEAVYSSELEEKVDILATVRHDDECGNGHNTFTITASVYKAGRRGEKNLLMGVCCHGIIRETMPDLAPLLKWHLCSTDGPLHYVANTLYLAREQGCRAAEPDLGAARRCAIWPEAELEDFTEEKLKARLPKLMEEFKKAVEGFGFIY